MDHERGAFFQEHEDDDVTGFAIIEVNEDSGQYRVAEKWERPDSEGGPTWVTYWIPEAALNERIRNKGCSYKQPLTDKQLNGFLKLSGERHRYTDPAPA